MLLRAGVTHECGVDALMNPAELPLLPPRPKRGPCKLVAGIHSEGVHDVAKPLQQVRVVAYGSDNSLTHKHRNQHVVVVHRTTGGPRTSAAGCIDCFVR